MPPIDLILISHNHYDHLDDASVRQLAQAHPHAHYIVPNGLRRWLLSRGAQTVIELDWWRTVDLAGCRVTAVPAQHFSGRGLFDRNHTLWCGFVLEIGGVRLYFAGDTGYLQDFADIGERFSPIDLALIPSALTSRAGSWSRCTSIPDKRCASIGMSVRGARWRCTGAGFG